MEKRPDSERPPFIVFEGGEGSGKSSIIAAVREAFGDRVFVTREPGGSPYAEHIRAAALKNPLAKTAPADTTLCLMFGARFDNVANGIAPQLSAGKAVISDRFDASSYAYQIHAQSDGSLEELFWVLRERLEVVPDLYIFADVAPEEGVRRARSRNRKLAEAYDHFDDREIAFHARVREGYVSFFSKLPSGSHVVIDANRPLAEVKSDAIAAVRRLLQRGR